MSPVRITVEPAQVVAGQPAPVRLRVLNQSRDLVDSLGLLVRIPGGAICLRGELKAEVQRLPPGAAVEIPLVVEFSGTGPQEFRVQVSGRTFERTFRVVESGGILVGRTAALADVEAEALACRATWTRAEGEYRAEVSVSGLAGSVVDSVWLGDRRLDLGPALPAGLPFRFRFCTPVPKADAPLHLHVDYRGPSGIRRQHREVWQLSSAGQRTLLFVAANPARMAGVRDLGGQGNAAPADSGEEELGWIPSDVEYQSLSEVLHDSAILQLASPCLATSYQSLLRHLLRARPRFLHFAGHGKDRHLILHGEDQEPLPVPVASVEDALQVLGRPLDLLVLNACHSEGTGRALKRLATAVIVTRGPLSNSAALQFSRAFYPALVAEAVPDPEAIRRAFIAGLGAVRAVGLDPAVYDLID